MPKISLCHYAVSFQLQNNYTHASSHDRNEAFLAYIKTCDDSALACLCEALTRNKQRHLAEHLLPHLQRLMPNYVEPSYESLKSAIEDNYQILVESMDCKATFPYLVWKGVLTTQKVIEV